MNTVSGLENRPAPPIVGKSLGKKYGMLTVLEYAGCKKRYAPFVKCACECGNTTIRRLSSIRSGKARSCGCLHDKQALVNLGTKTHGHAPAVGRPRTYAIWQGMNSRCYNPNRVAYPSYGGRGIRVCDRWRGEGGYVNFLADMGESAAGMSIERKDPDGNYCPENCYWLAWNLQSKNRRYNWLVSIDGQEMTAAEATERLGVRGKDTIAHHLRKRGFKKGECVPLESLFNKRYKTPITLCEGYRRESN